MLRVLERTELSVGELARVLQMPQSTVSRHLKVLTSAGWVSRRTFGTAHFVRMPSGDLAGPVFDLWRATLEQMPETATLAEDDRRLESVLDERQAGSETFFGRHAGEWDSMRADLFGRGFTSRALPALLPREWVVADLGCGTGNAAERLAPFVSRVIAVDASGAMLDAARKRLRRHDNVKFLEGDLSALPLEDGSVDATCCVLVLHHLERPEEAVREMRRVIRPGGVAMALDMFEHDRDEYRQAMGHKHLGFSEERMRGMFEEAGFDRARVATLRGAAEAKGPSLFVATARVPGGERERG
jgi:ArsR family transcriptional regulator